jgi:acetyl-CoA carboxylase biotin carboxyl carrier protein
MTGQLARDIEILVELFKAGGWSEVRLESDGVSLLLSTDRATPSLGSAAVAVPAAPSPVATATASQVVVESSVSLDARSDGAINPDWAAVEAPNLGTFYRSPKPGAAPFVEVGQRVEPNTEVCLIEVMKLFTSVQAGVAGAVRHIAVADAELVEGGQALIYIERD